MCSLTKRLKRSLSLSSMLKRRPNIVSIDFSPALNTTKHPVVGKLSAKRRMALYTGTAALLTYLKNGPALAKENHLHRTIVRREMEILAIATQSP